MMRPTPCFLLLLEVLAATISCEAPSRERRPAAILQGLPLLQEGRARCASSTDRSGGNADFIVVEAGSSMTLLQARGPAVIRRLWIGTDSDAQAAQVARELALRAWFDGDETPCVETPLGDFFGAGVGGKHDFTSLPLSVASRGRSLTCYFPMPFRRSARIEIRNDGASAVRLAYQIDLLETTFLPAATAIFHARYHQERPCRSGARYRLLEATGEGQYVGCILHVQTAWPGWWGEGDEIITVDHEAEPSIRGTATDHCFGTSNYPRESPIDPASAAVLAEPLGSLSTLRRFHLADPIPFHEHLTVELEHWGRVFDEQGKPLGNGERRDNYASVAFFYLSEPHLPQDPLPPLDERLFGPVSPEPRFADPALVEAAILARDALPREGNLAVLRHDPLIIPGGLTLGFEALRAGASISLAIEVHRGGPYELFARVFLTPAGGIYEALLDGNLLFQGIDAYGDPPRLAPSIYLGRADLVPGRHTLEFRATARSMYSRGFDLTVNSLRIVPLQ
ncbi:MAG: glycoside hydrolase family 172 protein [Planctomycetota bacterium]